MSRDAAYEVGSALAFCVIAFALLNPMHFWMLTMARMTMLAAGAVAFAVFAVFILREGAGDEREEAHRSVAGRAAFFAGSAVLILGIALESAAHTLDPWLVLGLVVMVLAKVAARLWSTRYR